jgi:predicted dinucleotide-binding enzyme
MLKVMEDQVMRGLASVDRREFLIAAMLVLVGATPVRGANTSITIGIIGGGHVAGNLARAWTKAGYKVMVSSRHPDKLKDVVQELGSNASAGSVKEAVAFGDVVLLAVPYSALPGIAKEHGAELATKKLVLDATNPIPQRDGDIAVKAKEKGVGEFTASLFPGAPIVRAFNGFAAERFSKGGMKGGERMGVPIAGDDLVAISLATDLVRATGYEPVLVGPTSFGNHLVPFGPLAGEHTPEEIRKIAATLK